MRTVAAVIRNLGPSLRGLLSPMSPGEHRNERPRADQQNRIVPHPRRNPRRRYAASETLSHLWAAFPAERESLRAYVDRAKSYRNECGCATGGMFVVAAIALLIFYGFVYRGFSVEHWLLDSVSAVACLFAAAIVGKMFGIGLARVRLMLLGRELRNRYQARGD